MFEPAYVIYRTYSHLTPALTSIRVIYILQRQPTAFKVSMNGIPPIFARFGCVIKLFYNHLNFYIIHLINGKVVKLYDSES